MSDMPPVAAAPAAAPAETTTQKVETVVTNVAGDITQALPVLVAVASALAPEAAAAIATASAIAKGVATGVPEAISLWNSFKGGAIPTQAQLDEYMAAENTAYDTVMADIQAKLAAAPAPATPPA